MNHELGTTCSIALCTYQGEPFLAEQLASFVHQTTLPTELVVVDDNSSDAPFDIAMAFAKTAPFPVRVLKNVGNLGPAQNFARALHECQSEIVFFSDQDDVW